MEAVRDSEMEAVIEEAESIIEERRREAADRIGVEVSQVEVHRLELSMLRQKGLLIDVDVHGTSMFQARTTYAELGIAADDVRAERLRRGSKDLFPEHARKLRSLEARARQNLASHSFKIAAFGQWSWMPWTAYGEFKEKHQEILDEMEEVKSRILAEYDDVREQNRAYFEQVARRAWKDMLAEYAPGDHVMIRTTDGTTFDSERGYDSFVEYVVQKALGKMPLKEEIERYVRIDYRTSILYGEHEVAQDAAALAKARAEEAAARARQQQAQLDQQTAEAKAQAEIEAFKAAEIEHARQQLEQMGSPIQDALNELRSNLYDAVQSLLAGLQRNGGFRGKASGKAAELYQYWQTLNGNLLQDDELENALKDLDGEMAQYQRTSDHDAQVGDITATLTEIAKLTSAEARKIRKHTASRAAALEL
jgi:hypothetical protein